MFQFRRDFDLQKLKGDDQRRSLIIKQPTVLCNLSFLLLIFIVHYRCKLQYVGK